jgi:ABC-type transporter Mla subunit MlaD
MPAVANASLTSRPVLAVLAAIVALLVAAALALWAQYGTAVFFEIIAAGIAACF